GIFSCANIGANPVTLFVVDNNNNTSSCTAVVTVQDNTNPVALCKDITIQLDQSGHAFITATQVDNGSSDICGIRSRIVLPNTFGCSNQGQNIATLTITDNNGNISSCQSSVSIEEKVLAAVTVNPATSIGCTSFTIDW